MKLQNPFPEYGYFGSEYFCDREKETANLIDALQNGSNVTLMAPRRIGKTGLIHHAFERMKIEDKAVQCFYADIFPAKTFTQMVELITNAVMGKLDTKSQSLKRRFNQFISSMRPTMVPDAYSGLPSFSFSIEPQHSHQTLKQVFEYMKALEQPCYLALDEFQQVSTFKEIGGDAYIRSLIQLSPNIHLIFSGSQQHLLSEMFISPKHPFFNSSQIMTIKEIALDRYYEFSNHFFLKQNREIPHDVFTYIYELVDGQTGYIQKILNRLYRTPDAPISIEDVHRVVIEIIGEQEVYFQNIYNLMTTNQAKLITAIAKEGVVSKPTEQKFIHQYLLPAPSSINTALKTLINNEIIYRKANGDYIVYDRFFRIWLKHLGISF